MKFVEILCKKISKFQIKRGKNFKSFEILLKFFSKFSLKCFDVFRNYFKVFSELPKDFYKNKK